MVDIPAFVKSVFGAAAEDDADRPQMPQEQINKYRNMITNAERYHKKQFVDAYARRYMGYLNGEMNGKTFAPSDDGFNQNTMYKIFCNEFFVNSETLKPNLYFKNPYVSLEAKQQFVEKRRAVPMVDLNGQMVLDEAGQPAMNEVVEKFDTAQVTTFFEPAINEVLTSKNIRWKKVAKKCVATMIPLNFAVAKWGWETEITGENMSLTLIKDEATCEWFNPFNFLPDPEATDTALTDAKFVIFRYYKPTEIIKRNPMYKGIKDLKGTTQLRFEGNDDESKFVRDYLGDLTDIERNALYEIWDIVGNKVVTFVDAKEYPIRVSDEFLWGLTRYPCSILTAGESLSGFYPTPDFRAYESLVMTKTLLVQKLTNLLLKLNRMFLYDKTALKDKDKVQQILDGGEAGAIGVDNPQGRDISSFVKNLNDFSYNDSYNQFIRVIDINIERLSGISDFQRGLISQARRTASEILNLQAGQNLRVDFKMDAIVDWMEDNIQLLIELLQANADSPRVQKVMRDSNIEWPIWDKTDIQGLWGVSVNVGEMQKPNQDLKRKEAMEEYGLFAENELVDQVENTKETMRAMGEKQPEKKMNQAAVERYRGMGGMEVDPVAGGAELPEGEGPTPTERAMGQLKPRSPVDLALARKGAT